MKKLKRLRRVRPLSSELLSAYQVPPTDLKVEIDGTWLNPLDACQTHGPYFVITPDNPLSELLSESENVQRRAMFENRVENSGITCAKTRARNIDGIWPDELGLALWGIDQEEAQRFSRKWNQYAFYSVVPNRVNVLTTERLGLFRWS